MREHLKHLWTEEDGVLAFEWTLLLTILVIGVVGGVAAARDAIIDEFGDVAQTMLAVDQSYTIHFPLFAEVHTSSNSAASDSAYLDALDYVDCDTSFPIAVGQAEPFPGAGFEVPIDDVDS